MGKFIISMLSFRMYHGAGPILLTHNSSCSRQTIKVLKAILTYFGKSKYAKAHLRKQCEEAHVDALQKIGKTRFGTNSLEKCLLHMRQLVQSGIIKFRVHSNFMVSEVSSDLVLMTF